MLKEARQKWNTKKARKRRERYEAALEGLRVSSRRDYQTEIGAAQAIGRDLIGKEVATGPTTLLSIVTDTYANPDALVGKKGLEIFDEMKRDDQVKAALFVKKLTRLSTQWFVQPASNSPQDRKVAEFYETQLENLPGTVIQMLLAQMTCLDYGYSLMEENYEYIKEGEFNGKIGLSSVKSRRPHDFTFKQDQHSNITALVQKQEGEDANLPIESSYTLYGCLSGKTRTAPAT